MDKTLTLITKKKQGERDWISLAWALRFQCPSPMTHLFWHGHTAWTFLNRPPAQKQTFKQMSLWGHSYWNHHTPQQHSLWEAAQETQLLGLSWWWWWCSSHPFLPTMLEAAWSWKTLSRKVSLLMSTLIDHCALIKSWGYDIVTHLIRFSDNSALWGRKSGFCVAGVSCPTKSFCFSPKWTHRRSILKC